MKIIVDKKTMPYFLICIFLILLNNDTFFYGTNSVDWLCSIPRYGAIVISILILFRIFQLKLQKRLYKYFPLLIVTELLYLSSCIINKDSITFAGIYMIYIAMAFLVVVAFDFKLFFIQFEKIMCFLCIVSIIVEIIAYILPTLIRLMPELYNVDGVPFVFFFIGGLDLRTLGTSFIRAGSIFWEPGVFALYINLALSFYLFTNDKIDFKRIFLYLLSVLITFSTTGYIVSAYLIFGYLLFCRDSSGKAFLISFIVVALLLVLLFDFSSLGYYVFGKLDDTTKGTTAARLGSIIVSFDIIKDNPLFGVGQSNLTNVFYDKMLIIMGQHSRDYSNGILYNAVAYGLPLGLISIVGFFRFSVNYNKSKFFNLYYVGFICLLFISEHLISSLPYIIIFYGILATKKGGVRNESIVY